MDRAVESKANNEDPPVNNKSTIESVIKDIWKYQGKQVKTWANLILSEVPLYPHRLSICWNLTNE